MINFDENGKEHNLNCCNIPNNTYRILILEGSGSGETIVLLNLMSRQPDIDKMYCYTKDSCAVKYQLLFKERKSIGSKHYNDPKSFIVSFIDMDDIYENIGKYNPNTKRKIFIVFDGTISDMINNKKVKLIVTELFIWGRKLNISIAFITQSYFAVPKNVRLNYTHPFIMQI